MESNFCEVSYPSPFAASYEGADGLYRKENMAAFLKVMKDKFGGAEAYVTEKCGLSKAEVEKIRESLIIEKLALHDKVLQSL
jgi:hypothetical protein